MMYCVTEYFSGYVKTSKSPACNLRSDTIGYSLPGLSLSHSTCHKKTRVNNFDQCIDHHVRTSAVHASSLGLSPSFACAGAPATIPRLASAYLQDLKRLKGIPALAKGSKDTVRASSSSCNSRRKSVQKKKALQLLPLASCQTRCHGQKRTRVSGSLGPCMGHGEGAKQKDLSKYVCGSLQAMQYKTTLRNKIRGMQELEGGCESWNVSC